MIDAFKIADLLSTYTLGGLVTLILIGSYFKIWLWYSTYIEMKTDLLQRLAKQEQLTERWQEAALGAAGRLEREAKQRP